MSRIRSSFALLVGCAWALGLGATAASAADMGLPTKAPPPMPAAPPPLDIHGFVEFDYSSFFINPQGQALAIKGAETVVAGLNWTVYKDKGGFINSVTLGGLVAVDFANSFDGHWGSYQAGPGAGNVNNPVFDIALAVTGSVTFGQYWTLSDDYFNVYSQDVAAAGSVQGTTCGVGAGIAANGCAGFPYLAFNQLKLALNDSFTGWPITFNPYVTWYYEFNGGGGGVAEPACFQCAANNGDFFVGITPTWNAKAWGLPQLTLKAPTYITVGPSSFWTNPTCCGVASSGALGIFTTGLTAVWGLTWIPSNYGSWYVKGGFQYFDIINNGLVASNQVSLGTTSNSATKDIWLGFAGIGVGF